MSQAIRFRMSVEDLRKNSTIIIFIYYVDLQQKALRKSKLSDENRLPSLRYGIINGNMNFSYFFTRGDGKEVLKLATNPGRGRK